MHLGKVIFQIPQGLIRLWTLHHTPSTALGPPHLCKSPWFSTCVFYQFLYEDI
jgi:hypothetical protein